MNQVMVDLETMGTSSNAAIIAIGAVKFDDSGLGDEFYRVVDLQSCLDVGLKFDASTVMWWMKQSNEARAEFRREGVLLPAALQNFTQWLGHVEEVWGNGASFDNVLLGSAYKAVSQKQPWEFWKDRCYRTMKALHPEVKMTRSGTHHNALDDAKSQALHLIEIFKSRQSIL